MKFSLFKRIWCVFCLLLLVTAASGQSRDTSTASSRIRKVIQFSGLVVGGDSLYGIPGVHIFVPEAGRGTISSIVGYFSMPVLEGDSVIIKTIGYKEKNLIIPRLDDNKLSVIVELAEDTLLLPEVEIFPWPTEEIFKQAFLDLKLPHSDIDNMHKNLNEQVMKRMLYTMDRDGAMNHHYYMQQQIQRQETKMLNPQMYLQNFLNPFAWAKFINQIKRGEYKDKSKDYKYEDDGY